ncbi:transcription factor bHLH95-like [Malania oleifera]|uniref:transcription factor bHLH95-like n=1 Tax=Malania oleifera TaxID=397392 RepID=UPI0025AE1D89|nr:transcription factor bHLH95-like [Malania oleifera]
MSQGRGYENFLRENQYLWPLSNLDNYGNNEEKSRKKLPDSSLNSHTVIEADLALPGKRQRTETRKNGEGSSEVSDHGKDHGVESDHDMHIWTERERRKKMRDMFSTLHALLPQLPPKADKSTIVDEATKYIKTLQQTLEKLQKKQQERRQGERSIVNCREPSKIEIRKKVLSINSRESFMADHVSSANLSITEKNSSNLLSVSPSPSPVMFQTWTSSNVILNICGGDAHISVCSPKKHGLLTTICFVLEKYNIEVVSAHISSDNHRSMYMIQAHASGASDKFLEKFIVEEIYKKAVGEIMLWISS